ncbi:EDD domain protein, DegV family [Lachnospiraceae bacterium RM5]|nr:EDD domain protein, DegV family [Lachnospiraceae bacterium RM5]
MSNANFHIISDGACDLLETYTTKHDIDIVPFYVTFDGESYTKEGEGISHDSFYLKMIEEHAVPKTSMPSVADYTEKMLKYVNEGIPVICVTISSKFSGSYNSACMAKEQILEDYPDAKISIIDSTLNTASQAVFINQAVLIRDAGVSYEDAVAHLEELKKSGRIYFTVGSMEYLVKNGRVGKLAVLAGDKIGIRPIIIMKNGDISLGGVARSRKKSLAKVLDCIETFFNKPENNKDEYDFIVACGYNTEEADIFKDELEKRLNIKCNPEIDCRIGTAIGCHTGPYALGIGIVKKSDII